jgi:hypothetical protein
MGQDQGIWAASAPGLVTDGQLGRVDPSVDVPTLFLGDDKEVKSLKARYRYGND